MPSPLRIAPSESPVKPIPRSARKFRRNRGVFISYSPSSDGHEIVVVEQDVNKALSSACFGGRGYLEGRKQVRLPPQESLADRLFFRLLEAPEPGLQDGFHSRARRGLKP